MAFIDQGEFEAMKMLSGCRAPHCDKHLFRTKMMVSTQTIFQDIITLSCLLGGFWATVQVLPIIKAPKEKGWVLK